MRCHWSNISLTESHIASILLGQAMTPLAFVAFGRHARLAGHGLSGWTSTVRILSYAPAHVQARDKCGWPWRACCDFV